MKSRVSPDVPSTRPLLDKLGVKPGSKVAIVDLDDQDFIALLRQRTTDIVRGRPRTPVDLVFMGARDAADLRRLKDVKKWIEPNGAGWGAAAKGRPRGAQEHGRHRGRACGRLCRQQDRELLGT